MKSLFLLNVLKKGGKFITVGFVEGEDSNTFGIYRSESSKTGFKAYAFDANGVAKFATVDLVEISKIHTRNQLQTAIAYVENIALSDLEPKQPTNRPIKMNENKPSADEGQVFTFLNGLSEKELKDFLNRVVLGKKPRKPSKQKKEK
jgi:hypothetical protein